MSPDSTGTSGSAGGRAPEADAAAGRPAPRQVPEARRRRAPARSRARAYHSVNPSTTALCASYRVA